MIMFTSFKTPHTLIGLLLSCMMVTAQANPQTLATAQSLMTAGKANEAYEMLLPLEDELASDAQFNYLLGIAALDSKQRSKAVFALERAVALAPDNAVYRAELARVYFELGEKTNAKNEFNAALAGNPPEAAQATINRYLSAMEITPQEKTRFNAHLQFGHGYDSNLNSATTASQIAIPLFGGLVFDLGNDAQKQSDNFNEVSIGAGFIHPLDNGFSIIGGVGHIERMPLNKTQFDTGSTNLNLGLAKHINQHTLSASYNDNNLSVNTERFRHAYGVNAQWQYDISAYQQFSIYTQLSRIAFPSTETRNANRYLIGTGYAQAFEHSLRPVVFLGAYVGKEDARDNGFSYVGFDFYGLRLGGKISLNPKWDVYGNLSYENRDYDGREPFFSVNRKDNQFDASLGLAFKPIPSISILPTINYTNNDTNYDLSKYERFVASINFRKNFDW